MPCLLSFAHIKNKVLFKLKNKGTFFSDIGASYSVFAETRTHYAWPSCTAVHQSMCTCTTEPSTSLASNLGANQQSTEHRPSD